MADWYCAPDGTQIGPFTEARLREMAQAGKIGPDDMVWSAGMPDWVPASAVRGLLAPLPTATASDEPDNSSGPAPIPLAYAAPASPRWPGAAAAPSTIEDDPGPFQTIGKAFRVNGSRWGGSVIVSPKAFYILKLAQRHDQIHGGGLVGALIASAAAGSHADTTRTCDLSELPSPVAEALNSQVRKPVSGGDVIIIRRESISRLKISSIGIMNAWVGDDRFEMTIPMFCGGRIRNFLAANGWTLNAQLTPTAAPTYGRPAGAAEPISAAQRAGRIALAVVLFVVVVCLRTGCAVSHHRY